MGELIKDRTTGLHVVFMEARGGKAHVRPRGGGLEREIDPFDVEPLPGAPVVEHIIPNPRHDSTKSADVA
ncbi:hypothetical protein [Kitasatospora sp. Ki12]